MVQRTFVTSWLIGLLACLLPLGPSAAQESETYRSFDQVRKQLEAWAGEHPDLLDLSTIGSSAAGAPLLVLRLAGPGEPAPDQRPALFVGANIAGYHNAGTEAALHLIRTLVQNPQLLPPTTTLYVAPALNPDAHDGMFGTPRQRLTGNRTQLDRDRDGLIQEDGPDDLDGNGRITQMRIPDPQERMLPDPSDPRLMIEADAMKGQAGAYRVIVEGIDNDGDGAFNEDGPGGEVPDKNFAHAYRVDDPEAGPWPSHAPESKALMDFLLARRNVAVALVYGPANNLLAPPQGFGGGGDPGTLKFKVPSFVAARMGFDPDQEYTIDEIWEVAKDFSFVVQNNITKEQLMQFLGGGPATKLEDDDAKYLTDLAKTYKERLEQAGLDTKRAGRQYQRGGFTPWLYYQYGVLALELDVWGVPKAEAPEKDEPENRPLTLDRLGQMSSEEFLELGEEKLTAFLQEIGAPPQINAAGLIQRVESGQVTPAQLAEMAQRMGAGGGGSEDEKEGGIDDLTTFIDAHAPDAFTAWTAVTLPDGTTAEVGGPDPFIEIAPPYELLAPALDVHTQTALDLAGKLASLEILELEARDLGAGVFRVRAVVGNRGYLPTHTAMARRAQSHLPVRLELKLGDRAERVTGPQRFRAERLEGHTGTLVGEWLVRTTGRRVEVTVEVLSENAGGAQRTLVLGGGS